MADETDLELEDELDPTDEEGDEDGEGEELSEGDAEDGGARQEQGDGSQGDGDGESRPEDGAGQPRTRGQNRVERALAEARAAREEARLAREEAQRLRQQPQVSEEERQRRRAEHLQSLDPDQRTDFLLREQQQRYDNQFAQLAFQNADAQDQSRFERLCDKNRAFARVSEQVERRLAEVRREGRNAPRELIAKVLIGEAAIRSAERTGPKRQRQAAEERQRQQARPGGARGDVGARRTRTNPADMDVSDIERLNGNALI